MPLIPSINELNANLSNDLKNKLNLSEGQLKRVLDVVALSISGQLKLTYLFLADIQNNVFPDTADSSENGGTLERQGRIHLNRNRAPATNAVFDVLVTGESGSTMRSGLTFKSNDDSLNAGNLYVLDEEYVLVDGVNTIQIRSLTGGSINLLDVNDTLTITEPVIGVDKNVTVSSIIESPLQAESVEDYRNAILKSIQLEPQGGAKTDYRLWADDAQGVRFIYPFVKEGEAGTVQIYVEATEEDSLDENGTPSQTILDNVSDVVEFDPDITQSTNERGRRPIQARLEILPINTIPVDVTITGLQITSPEIQSNIESNINEFLKSVRPFVAGADLARNKNDILYSGRIQSIITDTLEADNFFTNINMFVSGVEQISFLFSRDNIPYLNSLTIN